MANEPHRHRLASRIALVAVWSAAFGALVAALMAIGTVDRLLAEQADQRLRGAVIELSGELDEDWGDPPSKWLAETINDENGEIAASGIRLSVFQQGKLLAGRASASPPEPDSCATSGAVGQRIRACSRTYGPWLLIAEQPSDTDQLRWMYVVAALGAIVLGGGTGALLSRGLAPWAARPLAMLERALRSTQSAGDAEFGPSSACEDVEAVRLALRDRALRTQQLLEQAHRFAADAAHELRTPLTALRAELELLGEDTTSPDKAIKQAVARVSRLSELVERLLVLAMPGDKIAHGFETVAMSDVVEEVTAELSDADRRRVELQLDNEGLVRGDGELLGSLTSNALHNALRFGLDAPVTVSVKETSSGCVVLQVRDSGPGIPPELRQQVFQPFHRLRPQSSAGHGLGLALIDHIATVHGGSAEFVDMAQGACLKVTLPRWVPHPGGG